MVDRSRNGQDDHREGLPGRGATGKKRGRNDLATGLRDGSTGSTFNVSMYNL